MTTQIPPNLERFAVDFEQAARRELALTAQRSRRRTLRYAAASSTALAAIAAAAILVLSAATGTSPAYALTTNADGGITVSLENLTTGIPQLNARLQQLGIDFTVIPVVPDCSFTTPVLSGPSSDSLSDTITIGTPNTEPAGVNGYLAAEQLPNGQIALAMGGMKTALPTCFSPTLLTTQPRSTPNTGPSATSSTTTSAVPLPLPAAVRRQLKTADAGKPDTTATTTSLPSDTPK
jgi:hypothetical protein